ncbi:MBL fold metallo-hydrolase [Verrucomicrobiota bacterium sgz303538]
MAAITFTNLTRATEIGANSYSVEFAGKRLILDSGLHPRFDGEEALPQLGLLPDDSVDAIILTHAHQDHVGSLPVLMRRQPRAPVFMTEATRQLSDVMLHNSVNVMGKRRDEGFAAPLFSHREIDFAARRWMPAPLYQRFDLTGERLRPDEDAELSLEFYDAGHILGSVGAMIRAEGRSIFYTGDVNFENQTIMHAARFPEEPLDVLIIETTRGDSATPEGFTRATEETRFGLALQAAFARGGSVLVPLFALGKTQEVLAMLYQFRRQGILKESPIYIGGLSTKLTEIYDDLAHHTPRQKHDLQLLNEVAPFVLAGAEALTTQIRPGRIYALSSGMMTEKTLSNSFARQVLSDPAQSLYFVGYADPESPAGKIRATPRGGTVQLSPEFPSQPLECVVEQFSFSAHSTRESIRAYIQRTRPKTIVLVHGDPSAINWFQEAVKTDLPDTRIVVPPPGEPVEL